MFGTMRVLDVLSRDTGDNEHSNVIPVLPVQSRDRVMKTGRTSRRRRREARINDEGSSGERSLGQRSSVNNTVIGDRHDVTTTDEQRADAAAAILVSHYVTGQYVICISFASSLPPQNIQATVAVIDINTRL